MKPDTTTRAAAAVAIAAAEHVGAVGIISALRDARAAVLPDAAADHLAELLERRPSAHERACVRREVRLEALRQIRAELAEAEWHEDPEAVGIDVAELEEALRSDDAAEPTYVCDACRDTGEVSFRGLSGIGEREACSCTWVVGIAA
jgi:hypothetical protein